MGAEAQASELRSPVRIPAALRGVGMAGYGLWDLKLSPYLNSGNAHVVIPDPCRATETRLGRGPAANRPLTAALSYAPQVWHGSATTGQGAGDQRWYFTAGLEHFYEQAD